MLQPSEAGLEDSHFSADVDFGLATDDSCLWNCFCEWNVSFGMDSTLWFGSNPIEVYNGRYNGFILTADC